MARKMLVSVCMIARDEERVIERAIRSTEGLADEVVVVDTGSTDRTVEIAQRLGARVVREPWRDDFAFARNAALARARGEWIVVLDADECFDPADARRLRRILKGLPSQVSGATLRIVNTMVGDRSAVIDRTNAFRVFRNRPHHRYVGAIHEQIVNSLADGQLQRIDVVLWHDGYDPKLTAERGKIERNLRLLRKERENLAEGDLRAWYLEMQIGVEHVRMQDLAGAVDHLVAAAGLVRDVAFHPVNAPSFSVLVGLTTRVLIQLGRAEEARSLADGFLANGWNVPSAWFGRGWASVELGDVGNGVRDLLWASTLAQTLEGQSDYTSDGELQASWTLAVRAVLARGAPEAAAALLVHALRERPSQMDLIATATAIAHAFPPLATFLVERMPTAAVWPFVRQAAGEERLDLVAAGAARLEHDGEAHAPVAAALVAIAAGDRERARALLESVPSDSAAAGEATFALERLVGAAAPPRPAGTTGEVVA